MSSATITTPTLGSAPEQLTNQRIISGESNLDIDIVSGESNIDIDIVSGESDFDIIYGQSILILMVILSLVG